ncbi:MAG: CRISPR-associated protein Csx15 [candidate division WOR-3 bacterium]
MILLNFSHPITESQKAQIEAITNQKVEQVIEIRAQFDYAQPFVEQARALVDSVGLTANEWQTRPLLVNLPSLHMIAVVVLAELHGCMGYFPAVLRLRPVPETTPPQFEVAEVIHLQAVRDEARNRR